MKALLIILILLVSTTAADQKNENDKPKHYKARVTYYNPDSYYGSKVACQKTKRATKGVTVAAHPDFKFGTKIIIPSLSGIVGDGNFVVQDRGTAVTKKVASKGKGYVFDVYISNKNISKITKKVPMWMDVYVVH